MNHNQTELPPLAERISASLEKHGSILQARRSIMESSIGVYHAITAAFVSMMMRVGAPVRPEIALYASSILMDLNLQHADGLELIEMVFALETEGNPSDLPEGVPDIPANKDVLYALKEIVAAKDPRNALDLYYERYFRAAMKLAEQKDSMNYTLFLQAFMAQTSAGIAQTLGRVDQATLDDAIEGIKRSASESAEDVEQEMVFFKLMAEFGRQQIAELNEEEAAAGTPPEETPAGEEKGGSEDGQS